MKKWMFAGMALLLGGWLLFQYAAAPSGDTVESREALLRNESPNIPWNIEVEQELDDHLLCGITAGQRVGIAVFAPDGRGYELVSQRWLDHPDAIVIDHAVINEKWYDMVWFNGAQTEYAELTYTQPGEKSELRRFDTADGLVICSDMPSGDYTLEVRYLDAQGNVYE